MTHWINRHSRNFDAPYLRRGDHVQKTPTDDLAKCVDCSRHLTFRARLARTGECGGRTHVAHRTIETHADTRHPTSAVAAAYKKRPPILCPNTSTAADISHSAHDRRAAMGVATGRTKRKGPVGTRPHTRHPITAVSAAYRERPPIISPNTSTAADISHSAHNSRAPVCVAAAHAGPTESKGIHALTKHPSSAVAAAYRKRPPILWTNTATAADISHSAHDTRAPVCVAAAHANSTGPVATHPHTRHPTLAMATAYRKRPLKMCLNVSTAANISHPANDRRAPEGAAAARACATGPVSHRANSRHPTLAMAAAYRERPPKICPNTSTAADISHSAHDTRAQVAVAAARACLTGSLGTREKTKHATPAVPASYKKRPTTIWPNMSTAAVISHAAHDRRASVVVAAAHAHLKGPVGTRTNTRHPVSAIGAATENAHR